MSDQIMIYDFLQKKFFFFFTSFFDPVTLTLKEDHQTGQDF
jgi:hypothetical protein